MRFRYDVGAVFSVPLPEEEMCLIQIVNIHDLYGFLTQVFQDRLPVNAAMDLSEQIKRSTPLTKPVFVFVPNSKRLGWRYLGTTPVVTEQTPDFLDFHYDDHYDYIHGWKVKHWDMTFEDLPVPVPKEYRDLEDPTIYPPEEVSDWIKAGHRDRWWTAYFDKPDRRTT